MRHQVALRHDKAITPLPRQDHSSAMRSLFSPPNSKVRRNGEPNGRARLLPSPRKPRLGRSLALPDRISKDLRRR